MVQCKWCGYSLQPGMTACPSCGTAVPTSENNIPGQIFHGGGPPAYYFNNFAYQVSMTFTHGNSGGIAFRINANQQNGYLFNVTLGGIYGIFIIKNNQASATLTSGQSAAISTRPNAANLLTIVARGNNIFMYVNKQYVTSVTDGTYAAGQIGVFASDDTVASDVAFTKAEVWKL